MSDVHRATGPYQLMPQLSDEEWLALRHSVAEHGVMVPIIVDEDGNILDGHHRNAVCQSLGIECPRTVVPNLDEATKRSYARITNMTRRHLNRAQKREIIAAELTDNPWKSNNQIAKELGVSDVTVGTVRSDIGLESDFVVGSDGKTYTTARQSPTRTIMTLDKYRGKTDKQYPIGSSIYIVSDALEALAKLEDNSVDFVMTSPPFLALRSYLPTDHSHKELEIGSELSPAHFIDVMLALTTEFERVLTRHGAFCIELGDTYSGSSGSGSDHSMSNGHRFGQPEYDGSRGRQKELQDSGHSATWPLGKSLTLVPELFRVALAYGINPLTGEESPSGKWRVRNVVRWVRPNPPVGFIGDKFRTATTDMVIACKSKKRWFDLDAVSRVAEDGTLGGPPLDWWKINTAPFNDAHYATFPPDLCLTPIEAMCPRRVCKTCGVPSSRLTEVSYVAQGDIEAQKNSPKAAAAYPGQMRKEHSGAMTYGRAMKVTETIDWTTCGCEGTDGLSKDGFHTGYGWRSGVVLDPFAGSGTTLMVAAALGRNSIGIDLDERNSALAQNRIPDIDIHNWL
jgi:hypothetical protein